MKMCELPGRVHSPLGNDRSEKAITMVVVAHKAAPEELEAGESMVVSSNHVARHKNVKFGKGTFVSQTVNGRVLLTRTR